MNSILQALWTLPQLQRRYVDVARQIFETAQDPSNDFPTQVRLCTRGVIDDHAMAGTVTWVHAPARMHNEPKPPLETLQPHLFLLQIRMQTPSSIVTMPYTILSICVDMVAAVFKRSTDTWKPRKPFCGDSSLLALRRWQSWVLL